jgi:hypothetical protein
MVDVQPHRALYYPHLEFGSSAWVKGTLLYWEGIDRLVYVAQPNDDREIREMVEAGLIGNAAATESPTRTVAEALGGRLEDLLDQCGQLPDDIPPSRGLRGRRPELVARRLEEIASELDDLGHRRAATAMREHPEQALTFAVTVRAHLTASERNLAVVTDDPIYSAVDVYLGEAKVSSDPAKVPAGLAAADLLIPTPSIKALDSLTVPRLLDVRAKLAKQRRAFREKVEAHKTAIAQLEDVDAVREHMKAFASEIREDLEAEREAMREAKVKDDWSLLSVTAPASLAVGITIAGSAGTILAPLGGVGAMALGVSNWFVQRRKGKGGAGAGHYMLALEGALGRSGRGLEAGLNQLLQKKTA